MKQPDGKYHNLSREQINEMNTNKVPTSEKIRRSIVKALKLEPYLDQTGNTTETVDDNDTILSKGLSKSNTNENR